MIKETVENVPRLSSMKCGVKRNFINFVKYNPQQSIDYLGLLVNSQMLYLKIFFYFLHRIFAYRAVRWIWSQVVKIHVSARCELMGVKLPACELAAHYASFFFFSLYECQPNLFDYLAGVIGSVIHYPKDMAEMATEMKDNGYHTL